MLTWSKTKLIAWVRVRLGMARRQTRAPRSSSRLVTGLLLLSILFGFQDSGFARAASPTGLADSPWPMFQGDAAHTGRSPFKLPDRWPMALWQTKLNGPGGLGEHGIGMSIGLDGTVYVASFGALFAVDPTDGSIKWSYPTFHSRSTPAVGADGRIYWGHDISFSILTPDGEVVGEWQGLSNNGVFAGSPVIAPDGTIYVGKEGTWRFWPEGGDYAYYPPTYCYFGCWDDPVVTPAGLVLTRRGMGDYSAIAPNGTISWTRQISMAYSVSIGPDGTLYGSGRQGLLRAASPAGDTLWTFDTGDSLSGDIVYPPAIGSDGTLYFGSGYAGGFVRQAHIYALNPDGTLKWKYRALPRTTFEPPESFGVWAPIVADREDRALACAEDGQCYAMRPDGELLWIYSAINVPSFGVRTAPLLTADGLVLILDRNGVLHGVIEATSQIYLPMITR